MTRKGAKLTVKYDMGGRGKRTLVAKKARDKPDAHGGVICEISISDQGGLPCRWGREAEWTGPKGIWLGRETAEALVLALVEFYGLAGPAKGA